MKGIYGEINNGRSKNKFNSTAKIKSINKLKSRGFLTLFPIYKHGKFNKVE